MTSRFMLIFAAISGFIFVALGAFGAHVLSQSLGAAEMAWIHTGLEYQAFHTLAIFYGRGNWPGLRVEKLYAEYLLPVCSPLLLTGDKALKTPADLAQHTLLHDASRRDWQTYTRQLGLSHINVQQGPIFSHSAMVLQAAIHGQGVALANNVMAQSEIEAGRLVCPFNDVLVSKNAFYLVCHDSQAELGKIAAFRQWILAKAASEQEKFRFRYEQ